MLGEILEAARSYQSWIAYLKSKSNYYPELFICHNKIFDRMHPEIFVSTLVRKEFEGKWHTIHVVNSILEDTQNAKSLLLQRFIKHVYDVQLLYHISDITIDNKHLQDIDKIQIPEYDRVMNLKIRELNKHQS